MSFDNLRSGGNDKTNQSIRLAGLKSIYKSTESSNSAELKLYQPNFILINNNFGNNNSTLGSIFGDIVPMYSSTHALVSVIVTSAESLQNFIIQSSTVIICFLSYINEFFNSAIYQTFMLVTVGYDQVLSLPDTYKQLKNKYSELIKILLNESTRELLWIEFKLDVRSILEKILRLYVNVLRISQKFYLAFIVLMCLSVLNFSSILSNNSQSFLNDFLTNNSFNRTYSSINYADFSTIQDINAVSASAVTPSNPIEMVTKHVVQEGESVPYLAVMYGIDPETIRANNSINEDETLTREKELFIPWKDGYIFTSDKKLTLEEVSNIVSHSKDEIANENVYILTSENTFEPDSLIFIPTVNFQSVRDSIVKYQEKAAKEQKEREELEKSRQQILSRKAVVNNTTYQGVVRDVPVVEGMNWPTVGRISRCVEPGHVACDIANSSYPPVFASLSGTVTLVGFEAGGYGNYVIIDHGFINGHNIRTLYAHLSEVYVSNGQTVTPQEAIGRVGTTGFSTGPHLHFEVVVNGVKQNPLAYLQ